MEKKFETKEYELLIQTRKSQLANFRNIPNQLEVVWEKEGRVVLNNAASTNFESALEAISAVQERVVWITELECSEINFHGILSPILGRLDWVINVGENNPFQSLGKGAINKLTLKEALEFAWENLDQNTYLVYAPAMSSERSIKERGENFRELIKQICS